MLGRGINLKNIARYDHHRVGIGVLKSMVRYRI